MLQDNGQGEAENVVLGEEWSDKASFQQVIVCLCDDFYCIQDEYIKPYVTESFKVLELGIGGGRVAKRTASMVSEVHGLDISTEMLRKA